MELWTVWIIVAIVLLIIEVLTQMMWALCLTVGALGALVCSFVDVSLSWQIVVMAAMAIVAYAVFLPHFKRWHAKHDAKEARTGMDALLGRRAIVTQPIEPGMLGRARIDGDNWQVKAPGLTVTVLPGTEVSVTAYDGNILTVELINS
ncbi:MAG: NfeD family protein [Prevotella sp.]|nr:NfeD family protein [Prevotella sp.]MCM1074237.1 NfeD family protein [Ruminococcus sp.]